jgi:hypothetical protein
VFEDLGAQYGVGGLVGCPVTAVRYDVDTGPGFQVESDVLIAGEQVPQPTVNVPRSALNNSAEVPAFEHGRVEGSRFGVHQPAPLPCHYEQMKVWVVVADYGMAGSSVEAVLGHEPTVKELAAIEGVEYGESGKVRSSGIRGYRVGYGGLSVEMHEVDGDLADSDLIREGWTRETWTVLS